jgi:hypothetical protein
MNQKAVLVKALRILASAIDELNDEKLNQLLTGKAKIVFSQTGKLKGVRPEVLGDHAELAHRLNECSDRDQARTILSEITNKDTLISFAKTQKLHILKSDRRDDVENKIIEFIVGAKLRTEAIQTLDMKGGGNHSTD